MPIARTGIQAIIITLLAVPASHAFECTVCHSKNPRMVAMHKALQGRNCFDCHRVGEKLMGKNAPKDRDSLLKRRVSEPICLPCHGAKEPS